MAKISQELQRIHDLIMSAKQPENIFGFRLCVNDSTEEAQSEAEQLDALKSLYHQLLKTVHPDKYNDLPEERDIAEEAFKELGTRYTEAQKRVKQGVYGKDEPLNDSEIESKFVIKTREREYQVTSHLAEGDIANLYRCNFTTQGNSKYQGVVKVVMDPEDTNLLENEIHILEALWAKEAPQHKHLPRLIDRFKTTEEQLGIMISYFVGKDLPTIRAEEQYRQGVPQIHAAWMIERLLSVIGFAHSLGIIHGNICPEHIIINKPNHGLCLVDWTYAAINPKQTEDGFKGFNKQFSAPEVLERKHPIPASDLYSVGKVFVYLLGGNLKDNSVPANVDLRIKRFIDFMLINHSRMRAQDAWETYGQLKTLRTEVFGQHKFLKFE